MKKTTIVFILIVSIILSLAGCGKTAPEESSAPTAEPQVTAEAQAPAEEDGQNPVMNFIGVYSTDYSTEALVEAEGAENAKITVTYAGSPWFHHQTIMSGRFDPETLTVEFADAVMTEYTYKSDGSVDKETVSYRDGKGRAVFAPADNTLTITEVFPSGDTETVYAWGPAADMKYVSDPDHYASVTAMDKAEVETVVGFNVRSAYLSQNWYALADMIRYPITINGTELADADAFLGYMIDKTVSESHRAAMLEEDFLDMFVNFQGIMMGDGEIWLSDPNYGTDKEPVLEIIAINGIVKPSPIRQDGERFEDVIILEGMDETVQYEHFRNDALGFEMDYDYENFVRRSEADRELIISVWDDPEHPEDYMELTHSTDDPETAAAAIREALSKEYKLYTDTRVLDRAGDCIWIDASEIAAGGYMPPLLLDVFIIPTADGCIIATEHLTIENSEGMGRRFTYMLHTLSVIG